MQTFRQINFRFYKKRQIILLHKKTYSDEVLAYCSLKAKI